jgi:murein L,D-transpeptidase YafK
MHYISLIIISIFITGCSIFDAEPEFGESVSGKYYNTKECNKEMAVAGDIVEEDLVDSIIVYKSKRIMELYREGELVDTLPISLGKNPQGHKVKQGDNRTPEGQYWIHRKICSQKYYRSLSISYPRDIDRSKARSKGHHPGGDITIHAQPTWNAAGKANDYTFSKDWTRGCIAVGNAQMKRLWYAVREGVSITIKK